MKTYIDYGVLIDEAMHIIVKKSLKIATEQDFIGDHHFFISFITQYPGVMLSKNLQKTYPYEMTIVLQFQFEELRVSDEYFSVKLSFNNVLEKIVVPFSAITVFADPSVKFGLQFRHIEMDQDQTNTHPMFDKKTPKNTKAKQKLEKQIKDSKADNVITLDSFRKK
jgi:hypothetical protein